MGCCGNKRAQLAQRQVPPVPRDGVQSVDTRTRRPRAPRIFEYIGNATLTLRGTASGITYRFARPGDFLEVAYEDAFAMLAEQDVRPKAQA